MKPQMAESRFKVGDRVRLKYNLNTRYLSGSEHIVTGVKRHHDCEFICVGDDPGGWLTEHFELVQPADAPAAPAEQAKEDRYAQHRQYYESGTGAAMLASWADSNPGNIEARQRNIAALAAEHARSAESSGLLHPQSYWSLRNNNRRKK